MDLRELTYFNAVYEERNVSAAARRCFISQPSVSAALASLEHELEARLFVRHRTGVTPTAAAEQLYPRARKLVDDAGALKSALRAPSKAARLTIGLMRSLDVDRTREILSLFTRTPDVQLRLVTDGEPSDMRVVSNLLVEKGDTFVPLWSERFVVALPSAHPLASRAKLRALDLAGEPVIERCHCEVSRHLPRGRRRLDVVAVAHSEEWAIARVAPGVGVGIVPAGVRGDPHVTLRELSDVNVSRQVGIAHPAKRPLSEQAERMVGEARRWFVR